MIMDDFVQYRQVRADRLTAGPVIIEPATNIETAIVTISIGDVVSILASNGETYVYQTDTLIMTEWSSQ